MAEEKPEMSIKSSADSSAKKHKAPVEWDKDMENVIVKIPRGTTAMSDPSGLSTFIQKLLLEEDEGRLNDLGPVEAARRAVALNYEALECSLFQLKHTESAQRRARDLEKSNTALRKELTDIKILAGAAEKRVKEVESELKAVRATLDMEREMAKVEVEAYKESIASFKKEKEELTERLEGVAYEAMLAERNNLMKQFLAGEHTSWDTQLWIRKYARIETGLSSSSEGEEDVEGVDKDGGRGEAVEEKGKGEIVGTGEGMDRVGEMTPIEIAEGTPVVASAGGDQDVAASV